MSKTKSQSTHRWIAPLRSMGFFLCVLSHLGACSESIVEGSSPDGSPISCEMEGNCDSVDGGETLLDAGPESEIDATEPEPACSNTIDSTITADELPTLGASANFRTSESTRFDTAGEILNSERVWDVSGEFPGDRDVEITFENVTGRWFADSFPDATYTALLNSDSDNLGVYQLSQNGLYLLGFVSPSDGPTRTQMSYEPKVLVYQLPLSADATWSGTHNLRGVVEGVFTIFTESYTSEVNAAGTVKTPSGNFETLRVRTDRSRTAGNTVTTYRRFNFVSECFGSVASLLSLEGETDVDFSNVAEISRLAP